ncbi:kinase-like protein [Clavulina sp. PMI_390]|nr:kinase-like protein [Clavulina sp. PMI_390]
MLAQSIVNDPESFDIMDRHTNEDFFLEILQSALDNPPQRLGTNRPRILRSLQNIVTRSSKLPRRVRTLKVLNRKFKTAGGEASIWSAHLDGKAVALREAHPPENGDWTSSEGHRIVMAIRREIVSQIQIHHPNILPILGVSCTNDHPLSIITPLAVNGNAIRYLSSLDVPTQRAAATLNIVCDIASALKYLHGLLPPIVHGDLHARNILIDAEGNGLLCDFGFSRIKHEETRSETHIAQGGKLRHLAPELLLPSEAASFRTTTASDCYAFGMTILELTTLQKPFAEYPNEWAASNAAQRGLRPRRPPPGNFGALSDATVDLVWILITDMWDHEAPNRPNMPVVLTRLIEISRFHGK